MFISIYSTFVFVFMWLVSCFYIKRWFGSLYYQMWWYCCCCTKSQAKRPVILRVFCTNFQPEASPPSLFVVHLLLCSLEHINTFFWKSWTRNLRSFGTKNKDEFSFVYCKEKTIFTRQPPIFGQHCSTCKYINGMLSVNFFYFFCTF